MFSTTHLVTWTGWMSGDGEDRRESREDPWLGWTGGCSASGRVGGLGGWGERERPVGPAQTRGEARFVARAWPRGRE